MESLLRRLHLRRGDRQESEARKRLQQELFSFDKQLEQGFPYKPSALAHDPKLGLLAVGTKSGALRIYGKPGVQFSGQHNENVSISQIMFLPDQGRLVTLCTDNTLHLWEICNDGEYYSTLSEIASCAVESSKQQMVSACCLSSKSDQIYVGMETGVLYVLDVACFKLQPSAVNPDLLMKSVPSDMRANAGAIEQIVQHPTSPSKILIGFDRGLIILWNTHNQESEHVYVSFQQLESLTFNRNGTEFISCHTDGSYIIWTVDNPDFPREPATTPYGPFPCRAITKMEWKSTSLGELLMIFSGGMPRASHSDKYTVTVMQGENEHVVFDFTSKVIDFITLSAGDDQPNLAADEPNSLLVLAEEELVVIDLSTRDWPVFNNPYLCSLHNSAITCVSYANNVPENLWSKISDVGRLQSAGFSQREWPIHGGSTSAHDLLCRDMLLTGHEDGSVRFWDISYGGLRLLYKLNTAPFFGVDTSAHPDSDSGVEWPPFRKVGQYDPFTDDPRLAVQHVCLCVLSETLLIAGSSGQVIVMQFEREERESNVRMSTVGIADGSEGSDAFVWRGHSALEVQCGIEGTDSKLAPGFQPFCIVQLQPPATCLSAALHSEWQLFAVGTAYGFCVFDYSQRKPVFARCTYLPSAASADKVPVSRRKSLQRSLRNSFRRIRRFRSLSTGRSAEKSAPLPDTDIKVEQQRKEEGDGDASAAAITSSTAAATAAENVVVNSSAEQSHHATTSSNPASACLSPSYQETSSPTLSTVGCLYFADTFLLNAQSSTPTLWVGTNAGTILAYQLIVPSSSKRAEDVVQCILAKEIRLRHGAPVVSLSVIDRLGSPLPAMLEVQHERAKAPDMTGGHRIVICSKEQLKMFSLPNLKPENKYKLHDRQSSVTEGQNIRRLRSASFAGFRSRSDQSYVEHDLLCLLTSGQIEVYTVPELRRQIVCDVIDRDNVIGQNLCKFTDSGRGFCMHSPSELHQFSLSAHVTVRSMCQLHIKNGARPSLNLSPSAAAAATGNAAKTTPPPGADVHGAAEPDNSTTSQPLPGNGSTCPTGQGNSNILSPVLNASLAGGDVTVDSVNIHVNVCEAPPPKVYGTDTVLSKLLMPSSQCDKADVADSSYSLELKSAEANAADVRCTWNNSDANSLKREMVLLATSTVSAVPGP